MTLQQLRYIIAIAECGSITSAAQKLLIAQPTLSKSVSEQMCIRDRPRKCLSELLFRCTPILSAI